MCIDQGGEGTHVPKKTVGWPLWVIHSYHPIPGLRNWLPGAAQVPTNAKKRKLHNQRRSNIEVILLELVSGKLAKKHLYLDGKHRCRKPTQWCVHQQDTEQTTCKACRERIWLHMMEFHHFCLIIFNFWIIILPKIIPSPNLKYAVRHFGFALDLFTLGSSKMGMGWDASKNIKRSSHLTSHD